MKKNCLVRGAGCLFLTFFLLTGCELFFPRVPLNQQYQQKEQHQLQNRVTHVAGSIGGPGFDDGIGSAARFCTPNGISSDESYIYVADSGNRTIRRIDKSTGMVETIAGSAGSYGSIDGTGSSVRFSCPIGITSDGSHLYVTDNYNHTIRNIEKGTWMVTTIAGTVGSPGSTDGTGSAARFEEPYGITSDNLYLYVADARNNIIKKN
jgi:hypothetical protein